MGEVGVVLDHGLEWRLNWRRHLFMWEEEILLCLMDDLEGVRLSNKADVWRWKLEEKGGFLVSSSYTRLAGLSFGDVP